MHCSTSSNHVASWAEALHHVKTHQHRSSAPTRRSPSRSSFSYSSDEGDNEVESYSFFSSDDNDYEKDLSSSTSSSDSDLSSAQLGLANVVECPSSLRELFIPPVPPPTPSPKPICLHFSHSHTEDEPCSDRDDDVSQPSKSSQESSYLLHGQQHTITSLYSASADWIILSQHLTYPTEETRALKDWAEDNASEFGLLFAPADADHAPYTQTNAIILG